MFNIIEERIKLNMKTETREERTLDTPMVANGMREAFSFLWAARHRFLSPPKVAAQGGYGGGKVAAKGEKWLELCFWDFRMCRMVWLDEWTKIG